MQISDKGLSGLVLEIQTCLSDKRFGYTDSASVPLSAVKQVRDEVDF